MEKRKDPKKQLSTIHKIFVDSGLLDQKFENLAPELAQYKKVLLGKNTFGKMSAIDRNRWLMEKNRRDNTFKNLVKNSIDLDKKDSKSVPRGTEATIAEKRNSAQAGM